MFLGGTRLMSDGALEAALDGPTQADDSAVGDTAVGDTAARGAPYRGLASFEQGDAHLFFGREDVTERLVAAVADDADFHDLPLVLVGSSGAGKSSVLRAGLLPRLTGPAAVFEPTAEPLAALKTAQQYLSDTWPLNPKRPVLIVDQFETLFTACQDETLRHAFVSELCELAESRGAHVVIAVRADFYDRVIRYAELANALEYRQVVLRPMTADDVTRAITEPARQASLNVEAALVRLLLEDLTPQKDPATTRRSPRLTRTGSITLTSSAEGAYEPGALPLLSHAMLATWEKSQGSTLTVADYLASGRIRDAVARTAEAAFEALTQPERQLARRLFLHLVHVLDDAPPTRATLALAELRDWGPDAGHVLDVFVGERMITVDADNARITHDALLTAWPRLHGWIDSGQAGLITRRRIADAARAWDDAGREATWLWRGGQLAIATEWAADPANHGTLAKVASEFVDASSHSERARQVPGRRRARRLQLIVAILAVLVLVAGAAAGYAFTQRRDAVAASDNASSRQLAAQAQQLRTRDPAMAAQLSVASWGIAHTAQAAGALLESSDAPTGTRIADTAGVAQWVAISPNHNLMAVAGADGTLNLWNVAAPGTPVLVDHLVPANGDVPLYVTAFSPDGTTLAAAGAGQQVRLWNISNPASPVPLPTLTGPTSTIYSVAFSPDGKTVAAGSADGSAWLWSGQATAGQPLPSTAGAATGAVNSVAFGLDGRVLATGSADGRVRLWSLAASGKPQLADTLSGPADAVSGVAFSPAGELAAASHDDKAWLWKVSFATVTKKVKAAKGKPKTVTSTALQAAADGTLADATNAANAVSFSPDGTMLAAGTSEGSVLVWTVAGHSLLARIPAPQPVTSVTWDGAGRVADSGADGTATIWTLPTPVLLTNNKAASVAYSPNGSVIAVGGTNVELRNAATHALLATQALPGVNGLSFSPDGRYLAAALDTGMVQVMEAATLAPVGDAFRVTASGSAESVAFSPDSQVLATGSDDGSVRSFSMANPGHPALLSKVRDSTAQVYTVAFAPDGTTLAAASTDDKTWLWNVSNPASPQRAGTALDGLSGYAIALAFSPDSKLLAVGSADKTVHLWNVANLANPIQVGAPLAGPSGSVRGAAISPDGTTLAVGSTDGSVWLWNISQPARPTLIATLAGPAGQVYSVAFSPDGTQLAASSSDGTVHLWSTTPTAARAQVCASLGQLLTPAQWAAYVPGVPYKAPCS
jgi:WD40 repeat protein